MCCSWLAENTGCKKSPSGHHRTTLSGYIFATNAHTDNRKKLLSSNISSTCPHNMVNFSPLAAEIVSLVWGTPANFHGFRVFAEVLHGTSVLGVSQTLRHWTNGVTYIRQGGHHVGHWPTFLVTSVLMKSFDLHVFSIRYACKQSGTLLLCLCIRRQPNFASRRKIYNGHARLCVCLSVRGRTPTLLHGPGCNLGWHGLVSGLQYTFEELEGESSRF